MAAAVALPYLYTVRETLIWAEMGKTHSKYSAMAVRAGVELSAGTIAVVTGVNSNLKTCGLASVAALATGPRGQLLYIPSKIPSGSNGTGFSKFDVIFDTSALAVGDPIYLATNGQIDSVPLAGQKGQVIVGYVASVGASGRVTLDLDNAVRYVTDQASNYGGTPIVFEFAVAASASKTITPPFGCTIIDIWNVSAGNGGAGSIGLTNDGATVVAGLTVSATAAAVSRTTSAANRVVTAAKNLVATAAANGACTLYVSAIRS